MHAWGLNVFAYLCFPFRYMRTHDTKSSLLQVAIGNVTALSEVTYEYGVKTKVKPSVEIQPPTSEVVPVFPQGSSECCLTDRLLSLKKSWSTYQHSRASKYDKKCHCIT